MLNHQLGFLEKNQNKIKEQKRNKAMNLTTRINKVKEWLEHVCKPLTHVE